MAVANHPKSGAPRHCSSRSLISAWAMMSSTSIALSQRNDRQPLHSAQSEKTRATDHQANGGSQDPLGDVGYTVPDSGKDDASALDAMLISTRLGEIPAQAPGLAVGSNSSEDDLHHGIPTENTVNLKPDFSHTSGKAPQLASLIEDQLSTLRRLQLVREGSTST
ncbi:hypothetical protein FGG08_002643 [Glutinoglossum americanum]|uniref:Uncharacterized protein n=1 Tax=Glutinoglossum americanum TaxID=1670608 RepID=A0A9P8IBA9_9PEZI|nr:hypothetical protein FGG08_002643 [Glutinoglossum americanum]